jgi:hypothetical protein
MVPVSTEDRVAPDLCFRHVLLPVRVAVELDPSERRTFAEVNDKRICASPLDQRVPSRMRRRGPVVDATAFERDVNMGSFIRDHRISLSWLVKPLVAVNPIRERQPDGKSEAQPFAACPVDVL